MLDKSSSQGFGAAEAGKVCCFGHTTAGIKGRTGSVDPHHFDVFGGAHTEL